MPDVYPNIIGLYNKKVQKILKESSIDHKRFINMLKDLENLNKKIVPYFAERDSSGRFPRISGKDFNEIVEGYNQLLFTCNSLSNDARIDSAAKDQIDAIKQSIFGDYQAMLDFGDQKDDAQINLFAVINDYKAKQISVNTDNLKTIGNVLSSRIPVSITDEIGKTEKGFFTKEKNLDSAENFWVWLEDATKMKSPLAPSVKKIYDKYKEEKTKVKGGKPLTPAEEKKITWQFMDDLVNINYKGHLNPKNRNSPYIGGYKSLARLNAMAETLGMSPSYKNFIDSDYASSKTLDSGESFRSITVAHSLYYNGLQCKDSDTIDKNNVAMTDVATLLGASDIVCKSKSMKMNINGQEVNGTFMEEASGIQIDHLPKKHPLYGKDLNSINIGKGLQKMADLQVIDYICCNIDRHAGNMFYQFDEAGNFIGVQGIDNDCSFGQVTELNGGMKELPGIKQMKYISRDMADRITLCSEQVLRMSLGTRGLRKEQIDACCTRLNQIKNAIISNDIKVRTTEEFEQLGKDLLDPVKKDSINLPEECYISTGLAILKKISKQQPVASKDENGLKFNEGKETAPTGMDSSRLSDMADKQNDLFNKLTKGVKKLADTPEFTKLQSAIKSLNGLKTIYETEPKLGHTAQVRYESVLKRISKAADKFMKANPKIGKKISACLTDMKNLCVNDLGELKKSINEQQNSMERHTDYLADVLGKERVHYEKLDSFAKVIDGKQPDPKAVGDMIKDLNKYVLANPKASPSNCYAKTIVTKGMEYLKEKGFKESGLTKADVKDAKEVVARGRSVETVKSESKIEKENTILSQSMGSIGR